MSSPVDLAATPDTCFWGYLDAAQPTTLCVDPGSTVRIEAVTHHAGDAPDLMMDEGVQAIWDGIPTAERTPGVHIMTGPIEVRGAAPGDALVVEILELAPRVPYGSNVAAHWGRLYDDFGKERVTIYGLENAAAFADSAPDFPPTARPLFGFDFTERPLYDQPGAVSPADPDRRQPFGVDVAVPVRPHLGVMGVAPPGDERLDSVPPGVFGGNVDNWRFGAGATIRYPVFHPGAGFYVGDPHFAQGDGELCGTAIEASLTAVLRLSLEAGAAPEAPMLVHDGRIYTHGFGADLDEAVIHASRQMVDLMQHRFGLSADEAYSLASVAVDLGITQIVDGTVGCHAAIDPTMFD